ncbi:phasin family protein [Syntrophomonas erecta subsp. sporosyntropha]
MSMMKKALYLGLGIFSVTRERAEKMVSELVEKGEMTRDEAKQVIDDMVTRGEEEKEGMRKMVQEEVDKLKKELPLVSRGELEALQVRIEALEQKIGQE